MVVQYLNNAFDNLRRGTAKVLNPQLIILTVDGEHSRYDRYVKFSGDSYELAELQISGAYGGTERPFMYMLKDKLEENRGNYAKRVFNENMWYDRHSKGWVVEWDAIAYELENICIENLMPEVSSELPPIKPKSQKKKSKYGYGTETLFASGQLVRCIHAEILY
jgi:hypothetical protein